MEAPTQRDLEREILDLRARLDDAEETLRAIRSGEVDALVVSAPNGAQVFTLKGAEQPYRILIETMNEGAVTIISDGTVLYSNRRFAEIIDSPLEQVIGSSFYQFVQPTERRAFQDLLRAGVDGPVTGEMSLVRRPGDEVPVLLAFCPLTNPDAEGVCVVVTDISEQRRAEAERAQLIKEQAARAEAEAAQARISGILESISDAFYALDRFWRFTYVNRKAEELYGRPREALLGKRLADVFPESIGTELFQAHEQAILEQRPIGQEVYAGSLERWLDVSIYPASDGLSVYSRDVTDRKQAEEERARLLRQSREAVRARDEFLSVAAHELKTPITGLRGFAQILALQMEREGTVPETRLRQAISAFDQQSARLARLVSQLLDVSRIESGKLQIEPAPVDLATIVAQAVDTVRLRGHTHEITVDVGPTAVLEADPVRIEQVITNLVDNACKYSPPGSQVRVELDQPSEEWLEICVRDYGDGVPPEHREHIFDRFYQAQVDGHNPGLGLGLYISRQIVELHGGELRADFPPEGGSRFVVRLPAKPVLTCSDGVVAA